MSSLCISFTILSIASLVPSSFFSPFLIPLFLLLFFPLS
jgi:hypothetical protein